MKLVLFGSTVVNMDRVNYIDLSPGVARLWLSAPFTPNGIESLMPDFVKLTGDDLTALIVWLVDNCERTSISVLKARALQDQEEDKTP